MIKKVIVMCGRFEANIPKEKLIQKFGINNWQLDNYQPRYNIPPGTSIPIIRQIGDNRIVNEALWGLIPSWSKDKKIAFRTFNARSETLAEKPSFRATYKHKRCLIPASGYYEWQKIDKNNKQPFWIGRKDKEPFAMAGIFENWTDTETGELIESCTIITRPSYQERKSIHDRMPVILPENYYSDWLSCELKGFPAEDMNELDYYPISNDVGSPKNNYSFERLNTDQQYK